MRNILRLGTYQCLWMDRVPHRAAVHETVQLARRFGHQGTARLANAVLRTLLRQHAGDTLPTAAADPVTHLAVMHSHPQWLVARWLHRYGWDRTRALCEANNRPAGITLRLNPLRTTSEELVQRLQREGCQHVTASRWHAEGLLVHGIDRLDTTGSYQEGLFQVQDEGAMFVAPLCDAQPGHRVLDACAAPGGKTTHLAHCMRDRGTIIALDAQAGRLRLLQENLRRLRLTSVTPLAADATRALPLHLTFDRILVDAPCSGLGVLRRHPDIKWRKSADDIQQLQAVQRTLLRNLLPYLASGGLLVYSVCSNEPEETHDVVRHILAHHPQLRLEPIVSPLPDELYQASTTAGTLDITPDQLGTDGVFIARFRHS
jgi:16S rRNA (cytosine967-C5)-methyltransferase